MGAAAWRQLPIQIKSIFMAETEIIDVQESAPGPQQTSTDPIWAEYGEPFIVDQNNKVKPNQRAIVAKFAEQENVVFIEGWKRFLRYDPNTGIWAEVQPNALKRQMS